MWLPSKEPLGFDRASTTTCSGGAGECKGEAGLKKCATPWLWFC